MNELEELYLRLDQLENYKRCIDEEIGADSLQNFGSVSIYERAEDSAF